MITRNASVRLNPFNIVAALDRHADGDWGELDEHDQAVNEAALNEGNRLLSAYTDSYGTKFWIITEANRSSTTILLPEDY